MNHEVRCGGKEEKADGAMNNEPLICMTSFRLREIDTITTTTTTTTTEQRRDWNQVNTAILRLRLRGGPPQSPTAPVLPTSALSHPQLHHSHHPPLCSYR